MSIALLVSIVLAQQSRWGSGACTKGKRFQQLDLFMLVHRTYVQEKWLYLRLGKDDTISMRFNYLIASQKYRAITRITKMDAMK